jgi:hypothetical protein
LNQPSPENIRARARAHPLCHKGIEASTTVNTDAACFGLFPICSKGVYTQHPQKLSILFRLHPRLDASVCHRPSHTTGRYIVIYPRVRSLTKVRPEQCGLFILSRGGGKRVSVFGSSSQKKHRCRWRVLQTLSAAGRAWRTACEESVNAAVWHRIVRSS